MAVLLLLAGLFLYSLELFVPSAGVLFFSATACVLWSVVTAFQVHWVAGLIFVAMVAGMSVVLPGVALRIWSNTPMGRQMFLKAPEPASASGESEVHPLVGEIGKTLTPLRPSGVAEVAGKRTDVLAEGGVMILEGEPIRVSQVVGNKVMVRRLTESESQVRQGKRNLIEDMDDDFLKS